MKKNAFQFFIILVFFILFVYVSIPYAIKRNLPGAISQKTDTKELDKTIVTSYLPHRIEKGKNLVYCSTFQITWNKLIDEYVHEPIELEGVPEAEVFLNQRLTGENDISKECYLAMVGKRDEGIVDKIKKEMKAKFGILPTLDLRFKGDKSLFNEELSIVSYAFLTKQLQFNKKFDSLIQPLQFNKEFTVKGFGIEDYNTEKAKQVTVLDYVNQDNFIISLKTKAPRDKLILAKITPEETLLATVGSVIERVKQNYDKPEIEENELLQIPKINFDILHIYDELLGRKFLNKGLKDYVVGAVLQKILFSLDETGAILKSEASFEPGYLSAEWPASQPRNFVFDKPFLALLVEEGAKYPYFALWVDNDEILVK